MESLESRLVPYSLSGNAWPRPELITLGFVPDGTIVGYNGSTPILSNLQSSFNTRFGSATTWQNEILKAAQVWAQQSNINFKVIADSGAEAGTGDYQQGDPNMADIRIGGYNFGSTTLAQAYMPAPVNNTSYAGDIQFNTGQTWNVGAQYDLFTVASHEFGHALGLYHSSIISATMNGSYTGTKTTLDADDISGIRTVTGYDAGDYNSPGYQGARLSDSYDSAASNATSTTASNVTAAINTTTKTALLSNLNITTTSDVDYYKFTVPTGLGGTLNVRAQSTNLSMLAPTLTLYNSSQSQLATQSASGTDYDGTTLSVSYSVTAGQTYFVKVTGLNSSAFGTGTYALALGFAGVAAPTASSPNTQILNGLDPSGGGGQATRVAYELQVNSYTSASQETSFDTRQAVAMDVNGNYAITWASLDQDGSGYGVYVQRYDSIGTKLGSESRVNTFTSGDQRFPAIAMNDSGTFVIAWASNGQDGAGWGVYAQRYDSTGTKVGGEFRVNSTTANDQTNPVVTLDSWGRFVIAWQDSGRDGNGWGIYAQRFSTNGSANGQEFRVNSYTTGDQVRPSAALDDLGNFTLAWSSDGQDGSGWGIFGQRFNWIGITLGDEFRVNAISQDYQDYSSVAVSPLGDYVITWSSKNQGSSGWDVFARRYDLFGIAQGSEFRVNSYQTNDQMYSTAAMDNEANFFITWSSYKQESVNDWGIRGQQYLQDGTAVGDELAINTTTSGDQKASSVAIASTGDAVVVWSGTGGGDSSGVFAQMYQLANGSGMSSLNEAGVPHGFNPDGCEDHAHDHEHDHDHGMADDCGCASCVGTAAAHLPASGYGSLPSPISNIQDLVNLLNQKNESRPTGGRGESRIVETTQDVRPTDNPNGPAVRSTQTPARTMPRRGASSNNPIANPISQVV